MKPGIRTTEFWLALIVALAGGLAATYAESEVGRMAGMVAAALSSLGYGASRAVVKRGPFTTTATLDTSTTHYTEGRDD